MNNLTNPASSIEASIRFPNNFSKPSQVDMIGKLVREVGNCRENWPGDWSADQIRSTLDFARKFPQNYTSDSQRRMLDNIRKLPNYNPNMG